MTSPNTSLVNKTVTGLLRYSTTLKKPGYQSIAALAARFDVSPRTMSRAVALLRARGNIYSARGRGVLLGPSIPDAQNGPIAAAPASRKLAEEIEQQIRGGELKVGMRMPKITHFTRTRHVSATTCIEALQVCAGHGLVHKRGKRWIVGPAHREGANSLTVRDGEAPVVLVLMPSRGAWYRIAATKTFIWPFFNTLGTELDKYGIRRRLMLMNRFRAVNFFPAGGDEIEEQIRALGNRYRGAIVYTQIIDPQTSGTLKDMLRRFCRFRRPVVFMDPMLRRTSMGGMSRRDVTDARCYFHCILNDAAGVELAVRAMADAGHRRIGFSATTQRGVRLRLQEVIAAAREYDPRLEILTEDQTGEFIGPPEDSPSRLPSLEVVTDRIETMIREDAAVADRGSGLRYHSVRRRLFGAAPGFVRLLRRNITALIAYNDSFARAYYYWLTFAGIPVPEKISLIGFDNMEVMTVYPLSTIDFGLSDLGYRVAHLIVGDIPVKPDDRQGNMSSRPVLVDRGSIGRPRIGGIVGGRNR